MNSFVSCVCRILQTINGLNMQVNSMRNNLRQSPPPRINKNSKLFTLQEVENGIKKLKTRKAKHLVELQAKYLKW